MPGSAFRLQSPRTPISAGCTDDPGHLPGPAHRRVQGFSHPGRALSGPELRMRLQRSHRQFIGGEWFVSIAALTGSSGCYATTPAEYLGERGGRVRHRIHRTGNEK